jgi:hypothetical protein
MRRKIHGVFGIVEGVNVEIDFNPITFIPLVLTHALARAHAHARARARARARAESLTMNHDDFIPTVAA